MDDNEAATNEVIQLRKNQQNNIAKTERAQEKQDKMLVDNQRTKAAGHTLISAKKGMQEE